MKKNILFYAILAFILFQGCTVVMTPYNSTPANIPVKEKNQKFYVKPSLSRNGSSSLTTTGVGAQSGVFFGKYGIVLADGFYYTGDDSEGNEKATLKSYEGSLGFGVFNFVTAKDRGDLGYFYGLAAGYGYGYNKSSFYGEKNIFSDSGDKYGGKYEGNYNKYFGQLTAGFSLWSMDIGYTYKYVYQDYTNIDTIDVIECIFPNADQIDSAYQEHIWFVRFGHDRMKFEFQAGRANRDEKSYIDTDEENDHLIIFDDSISMINFGVILTF